MVHRRLPQRVPRRLRGLPPAGDDGLGVDLPGDQKLRLLLKETGGVTEWAEPRGRQKRRRFTRSSSAASTVTEVVPSPTSSS